MKKITLLILLLVGGLSFGQTSAVPVGEKGSVSAEPQKQDLNQTQTKSATFSLTEPSDRMSRLENPVLQVNSFTNQDPQQRIAVPVFEDSLGRLSSVSGNATSSGQKSFNAPLNGVQNLAPIVITQSNSQTIEAGAEIACATPTSFRDNNMYRHFDLPGDFGIANGLSVDAVEFAIGTINTPGGFPITANIYSITPDTFPGGTLTLQGTAVYNATNADAATMVNLPISANIPAGQAMVMELVIVDDGTDTNFMRFGCNHGGQTGPSYIMAPVCGAATPTDFAALGLTQGLVWNVLGDDGGGPFPDPYCGPLDFTINVEPITLVDVAGISNVTSPVLNGTPDHEDFTAISGDMEQGMSYPIAMEGNTDGNFTNRFVVFIDWNQNDILNDAGEVYEMTDLLINSTGTDGQQVNGTIDVPNDAVVGTTRMRVKKIFGTTNFLDPCLGTGFGQAEDYSMNVTGGGGGGGVCGSPLLEVNQDFANACMANISQTGLAQSYVPLEPVSAGAGIHFEAASSGLNVTLSLWDGLPNAGGTMLATGTTPTAGDVWTDVFWDPVVNVTVGDTYFIVIEGDVALPCVSGSLSDVYAGGNVYANGGYQSFPQFDYTFRTYSCDGGGGGSSCDATNPSNGFQDGRGCSVNNNWTAANDIIVPADSDMTLNTIIPNIFMNPGAAASSVLVTIYDDAGGLPGTAVTSEIVVPVSSTVLGSAFGFDISAVEMDLPPVVLPGTPGVPTTYWVAIQVTTSDGGNAYWENSTASAIGNPLAFSDGTPFVYPDPSQDGVYTFIADCTGGGGGGTACSQDNPENAFENGFTTSQDQAQLMATDITVPVNTDFTLNTITVNIWMNPGSTLTSADIVFYDNIGGLPDSGSIIETQIAVVPVSQTVIGNNFGFDISEVVFDISPLLLAGDAALPTSYWVSLYVSISAGSGYLGSTSATIEGFNSAFSSDAGATWNTNAGWDSVYLFEGECEPLGGGGTYDDCSGAIAVSCGDTVTGETVTATDSGGNAAPDVFYKFTGSGAPQLVTISLCDGGTDYDSYLRIFDDCDLANELAFNDDFCGLQSQVSFLSDGTSTYYIMVEGFSSNSGNFSLAVTCQEMLPNDDCGGAIPVACGSTTNGTTVGATVDAVPTCVTTVTAPGVWYSLDDNSGLPGNITLSLCGSAYDTKLSVYSGTCAAPVCVTGNDDSCGLQSEVTFPSDGNTSYLILVHGFGNASGAFTLATTCTPTPPPNDLIVNSIDVDEIGFPYTDPNVAMAAATTEGGNPVGCDITGANGVWYNFVPQGNGTANATIITPAGTSSVTFYTAPDESSIETDLALVVQNSNQCAPGTTASINTVAGQAYYVFVLNTGGSTDIVIDGTNLGVEDNTIEGFSYYPNPSQEVINLQSVENIETVAIYNVLGQKVIDLNVNATTSQINVSALSTGTYIMKVSVNGQIGTYKILKK